jgi:hypothetical protein
VIYTVTGGSCSSADTIDIVVYQMDIACQATQDESAPGAEMVKQKSLLLVECRIIM